MPTINIFCDPSALSTMQCQSVRNDPASGFDTGSIFGNCSAILGGIPAATPTNVNCSDLSVIVAGDSNVINTFNTPAVNGCFNFIGNGANGVVNGCFQFLGGGDGNQINTFLSGTHIGFIGSVVSGGGGNVISDDGMNPASWAFIGGGSGNQVYGAYSSVAGGSSNLVRGCNSFIGGGNSNRIPQAGYTLNSIVGGCENLIGNVAPGATGVGFAFIGGGAANCIDSITAPNNDFSAIGAGALNTICDCSYAASIFGGFRNTVAGNSSFVGGGCANMICSALGSVDCAVITGGCNNLVAGAASFVGGGDTNVISSLLGPVNCSVIGGGLGNVVCDNGIATADYSFVGGGNINCAMGRFATVAGGVNNVAMGNCSFVGGGGGTTLPAGRNIAGGDNSFVGSGGNNVVSNTCGFASFIGGGTNNYVFGENSVVVGGFFNQISNCSLPVLGASYSFIGGGSDSIIHSSATQTTNYVVIGGGQQQTIGVGASNSGIFSGYGHTVLGLCSLIAGGANNFIDSTPATPTAFASIGGGQQHTVCAGTNHSGIFSGFNNCVAGSCSAILGGSGSSDGGLPFVGIFGQGVTGVIPNAFHAENLVAQNMPLYSVGPLPFPVGSKALYYQNIGGTCYVLIA